MSTGYCARSHGPRAHGCRGRGCTRSGITHILNLSNMEDTYPGHFKYMSIHMRDCESQTLFSVFETAAAFIRTGSRGGNKILIHW